MMPVNKEEIYCCPGCNNEVKSYHRFCYQCGEHLGAENTQINLFNNTYLQSAFGFFIAYLFICLFVQFTHWFESYNHLFWIEILLAVFTFYHFFKNYKDIRPILKFHQFSLLRLMGCISAAAIASVVINIIITQLNFSFFGTEPGYYEHYNMYSMPALIMVYSIAVYPAIIEELAFRGVLYNYLEKIADEKLVVIVTGFMFGIMHLSFISLTWLVTFGILTGAMRKRYGTIWYGVIFHFIFNLVAVLFDLYRHGLLFSN